MGKAAYRATAGWGSGAPQRRVDPKSRAAQQEARARKEREALREADAAKRARLRELRRARDESERTRLAAAPSDAKRPKVGKR
jgi:hypothetical protein